MGQYKRHSAEFKAKVTLEAIKGQRTLNEIAGEYRVHPGQIIQWKKHVLGVSAPCSSPRQSGSLGVRIVTLGRIGHPRMMLDHFGDAYRAYCAQTGRTVPQLHD